MTLAEATRRAMRAVLGNQLADYRAARAAFQAGELSAEQWEPLKRDFHNALERRQDTIAHEVKQLLRPKAASRCSDCHLAATTMIAGKGYCDGHAADAPRLPVPAGGMAA